MIIIVLADYKFMITLIHISKMLEKIIFKNKKEYTHEPFIVPIFFPVLILN